MRVLPLLAAALLAACGGANTGTQADRLFADPARHRMDTGARDDARREATLGIVTAARLSESGRYVVVLDFVDPYVKVFDGRGRFVRSFLRPGRGPGEARLPTALAVSGDTAILVSDATGRLMVFGFDGVLRHEGTGTMSVLAATAGCGDDWLVYGPRFGGGTTTPTWLHRVRLGDNGTLRSEDGFPDRQTADRLPHGVAYGLVSDGQRRLLWHTLGAETRLAAWSCGEAMPRLGAGVASTAETGIRTEPTPGGIQVAIGPGARARGGMAAVRGGVVVAELVTGKEPGSVTTHLVLRRDDGTRRSAVIPGSYILADSRPGVGILVSTSEPVPHVFLISEADLLASFGP